MLGLEMKLVYKIMNYIIVTCQILNVPVHNPLFYWMILCLIFAKGKYQTVPGIIIIMHWALYSLGGMVDQIHYYYIAAEKLIDREDQWKKYDSLVISLSYLSEIVGDWYPIYVIYKYVPHSFYKKLSACVCLFFNITKILPIVHFYFNFDNCTTFITYKLIHKCINSEFWIIWSNLQYIICIGSFLYYLLCMIILEKAIIPISRKGIKKQSIYKKVKLNSPYRMQILCIFHILSSLTVTPLGFQTREKIEYNFEPLRILLRNAGYYIIYFDRILIANFGDYDDQLTNNRDIYMNLEKNRMFKTDPLSVTKPSNLFVSTNMESTSNTYPSYLKNESRDYFMYSRGESSNTNIEDEPTLSNSINGISENNNINRMGNGEVSPMGSPNYYSPYDTPLGSPTKLVSSYDCPLDSPNKLVSPSLSPYLANPYSDKVRLNNDFEDDEYNSSFLLKNNTNEIGLNNNNSHNNNHNNHNNNYNNEENEENEDENEIKPIEDNNDLLNHKMENVIPNALTLPPFRTDKEYNIGTNNYKLTSDYLIDESESISQYSKTSYSHQRNESKGSFFFNTGKESDSLSQYSLSHKKKMSKGSFYFPTSQSQKVYTRSINSIIDPTKLSVSNSSNYRQNINSVITNNSNSSYSSNNYSNNNNNNNINKIRNSYYDNKALSINQNNNLNDESFTTESSISSFIHSNFNSASISYEKIYTERNSDKSYDKSYDSSSNKFYDSSTDKLYSKSLDISLKNNSISEDNNISSIKNVNLMLHKMPTLRVDDIGLVNVNKKFKYNNS